MIPRPSNLLTLSSAVALAGLLALPAALSAQSLNVLMYHHVANDTPPSTSTRVDDFAAHLDYLAEEHTVVDLVDALDAIRAGEALPDDAVAITFDDAYISVYENAWPLLREQDFPFTVFVNTGPLDNGSSITIDWDQAREMAQAGVRLLNHTHEHEYLIRSDAYNQAWLDSVRDTVQTAQQRLTEELGYEPEKILAYPFGEYNEPVQALVDDLGYIAMGQHSGGIAGFSDWLGLPRFAAGGTSANLDTLRVKLRSRPLPVATPLPDQVTNEARPQLTLQLLENDDVRWDAIQCFTGSGEPIPTELDSEQLTARADSPLRDGRHRYNCTAPSASTNTYYWFSQQWVIGQGPADR